MLVIALLTIVAPYPVASIAFGMMVAAAFFAATLVAVTTADTHKRQSPREKAAGKSRPAILQGPRRPPDRRPRRWRMLLSVAKQLGVRWDEAERGRRSRDPGLAHSVCLRSPKRATAASGRARRAPATWRAIDVAAATRPIRRVRQAAFSPESQAS